MTEPTSLGSNPIPLQDLTLLVYEIKQGKEQDFIRYYDNTIVPYLKKPDNKVADVVAWNFKYDDSTFFIFATAPNIPPWLNVKELNQLTEFVDVEGKTEEAYLLRALNLEKEHSRCSPWGWRRALETQCAPRARLSAAVLSQTGYSPKRPAYHSAASIFLKEDAGTSDRTSKVGRFAMASRDIDDLIPEFRPVATLLLQNCLDRGIEMQPYNPLRDPFE